MDLSFSNIPRLGLTKTKPKIGEIRLTTDGKRRKVFDGRCWQYLCLGDPNCRIQAKFTCRYHRTSLTNPIINKSSTSSSPPLNKIQRPKPGETQVLSNGNRRIWRGARWHSLCRADNCSIQAKDFCKAHQNQRMSLPNTNQNTPEKSSFKNRTRSLILNGETEHQHIESEDKSSPCKQDDISLQLSTSKRRCLDDNTPETVAVSPLQKRELHTRNGRRVRCNGLIWKHLCAAKKTDLYKRKSQRHNIPIEKTDQITETDQNISNQISTISSDTMDMSIQTSPITKIKNSKKRKTTGDINHGEHIVPKRKPYGQRRKKSNKSITLSLEPASLNTSISDIPTKDKFIEGSGLNDSDISLSLKATRFNTISQSIEIPIQSSSSPFSYESSSSSAILEQFGTIIKKEVEIEEESALICDPPISTNEIQFPCETLQDFLRVEEIKKKEFKLDCQRISYRLAKIQDCIGSISSITS